MPFPRLASPLLSGHRLAISSSPSRHLELTVSPPSLCSWFFYFSNVQAIATLWMTVLCIFLWGLLEGLIVKDFIAKVPDKITFWVDYATHPTPLSTRICMFLIFTAPPSPSPSPPPPAPPPPPPPPPAWRPSQTGRARHIGLGSDVDY